MSRIYAVESGFTTLGALADHRVAVRAGAVRGALLELERRIDARTGSGNARPLASQLDRVLEAAASDLVSSRGSGVVTVGDRQPAAVHAIAHRINERLGNLGKTVVLTDEPDRGRHFEQLRELTDEMRAGEVTAIVVLGGNPCFDAPADLGFAEAYAKVAHRIHLSLYCNETSLASKWYLPRAHFLESWGDARSWDGTLTVTQPQIAPLCAGKSPVELLAALLEIPGARPLDLVRAAVRGVIGETDFDARWKRGLHDGFFADTAFAQVTADVVDFEVPEPTEREGFEVVFVPDSRLFDGRFANNGWLQETPDSLTKLTWDNVAVVSPKTAAELDVSIGDVVELTAAGNKVRIPVYVMPGQADGSLAVQLGFGRVAAGSVGGAIARGIEPVGTDVYPLRTSHAPRFASVDVAKTGDRVRLATTQDHWAIDELGLEERGHRIGTLAREADLSEYEKHPEFAKHAVHHPPLESLWTETSEDGRKWGMTIDLTKCIGCDACTVACTSENNIPVVGKEEVLRGREMHWIRVDRYFKGHPGSPEIVHQPVTCQHCENAPCEQVCPVAATMHSDEGLNDMAYNRCIGTRYCANNCPYKVRRFNFFNSWKGIDEPENQLRQLAFNPEVTVRSRGVMEKCTYCVQRIQSAKHDARRGGGEIADGAIQTACQAACPTQAIVFGDLADDDSEVARLAGGPRAYQMLSELNVKPRTSYLARIRNPHPALAERKERHG